MTIRHIEQRDANAFVAAHHRHHKPVCGHRFSIGCYDGGKLVGVAIAGRPVARLIDPQTTVEVQRVCTDGTRNACSKLYGACRRAAKELGYERIVTYILEDEPGTSLKASGWRYSHTSRGGTWNHAGRPRRDEHPTCPKKQYASDLNETHDSRFHAPYSML